MWIKRVTPWRCAASATRRGALDVNGAISLCGRLGQNAHEVDDRIRSRDCSADSDAVKQIGLDELWWLAGYSRHLDTTGMAYGYAHHRAISEKRRHEMAASLLLPRSPCPCPALSHRVKTPPASPSFSQMEDGMTELEMERFLDDLEEANNQSLLTIIMPNGKTERLHI